MAQAHTYQESARSIYTAADCDHTAIELFAAETGAEVEQDWEHEQTTLTYPDGSKITMCGPQCDAS